jgi:hypothetical protein
MVSAPLPPAISATPVPVSPTLPGRSTPDPAAPRPVPFDVAVRRRAGDAPQRFTVTPETPTDCVADLGAALGAVPGSAMLIDGRTVEAETLLVKSGIANGSTVVLALSPSRARLDDGEVSRDVVAEVACVAGPDCAPWQGLWIGRHVIGRSSSAGICLDDPRVELHHGLLEIDEDGLWLTQLTGHVPLRVDGEPVGIAREILLPAVISIGSSELRLRHVGESRPPAVDGAARDTSRTTLGTNVEGPYAPWRRASGIEVLHPRWRA